MTDNRTTELRETAEGIDWEIPEAAELLREAADTIEDLRDRLQNQAFVLGMQDALGSGTCENANTDGYGFRFECSECRYSAIVNNCAARLDELPNFCPNCGRKVVSA